MVNLEEEIKNLRWQLELQTQELNLALKQLQWFVDMAQRRKIPVVKTINGALYYGPLKNI